MWRCLLKYIGPNGVFLALQFVLKAEFVSAAPSWGCVLCVDIPCAHPAAHTLLLFVRSLKKNNSHLSDSIYKTVTQPDTL